MQGHDDEGDDAQVIPQRTSHCFPSKPTKALKQHLKRQALLEKITSSQQPYSKSHARRLKRASKPENNLVSDLKQVESALPVVSETTTTMGPEDALGMNGDVDETVEGDGDVGKEQEGVERFVGTLGSQGNEKLTAKKRSRVLRSEASRLPAVLTNKEFKKDAFAAIRLHMMNQIKAEKQGRTEQGKKKKKGNK
ncbi:BQ2448_3595 [Microbotryum intermedium]|uniref:Ribosome biogenesis protein SLX9 n=1 Tax=Microbotryum intermedium TaxID=269621 RepID=A0A238FFP3_9BASI|nr:BQ2448_3595 [Microbotryum intermedium]